MRGVSVPTRRAFLGIGALVGLSAFGPSWAGLPAQAATVTSWDYPANKQLSGKAIEDRFAAIDQAYGIGEPLSEEDADFVLWYAQPSPVGSYALQTSVAASSGDKQEYQLQGSVSLEYCGNYVYRSDATLQVGSSAGERGEISIQMTQLVFGYSFPPNGAFLSVIGRLEYDEHAKSRDWFTVGKSDDIVGVAVASWQSCRATFATDGGVEVELVGVFS